MRFFKRDKKSHLSISGISINFDWYSILIITILSGVFAMVNSVFVFRNIENEISEASKNSDDSRKKTLNIDDIRMIIENREGGQKDSSGEIKEPEETTGNISEENSSDQVDQQGEQ